MSSPAVEIPVGVPVKRRSEMSIRERFEADKADLTAKAQSYLSGADGIEPLTTTELAQQAKRNRDNIADTEKQAEEQLKLGTPEGIAKAIYLLEDIGEARLGIVTRNIDTEGAVGVRIRDARAANPEDQKRGAEPFKLQLINAYRGALDVVDISENLDLEQKEALKKELLEKTLQMLGEFKTRSAEFGLDDKGNIVSNGSADGADKEVEKSEVKMSKALDEMIKKGLVPLLEKDGADRAVPKDKSAYTRISVAKDYQGYNLTHRNIVSISNVGKGHVAIQAEVAMKGLTREQKDEYRKTESDDKPRWFTVLPKWEQALVSKYRDKIVNGGHVMACQLWQLVGMKNAFEAITAIAKKDGTGFEIVSEDKHSGTLASISGDKGSMREIARLNASQAKEWIRAKAKLHIGSFNSGGKLASGHDKTIVPSLEQAAKDTDSDLSVTAFNAARIDSKSSNLKSAQILLSVVAGAVTGEGKEFDLLRSYLKRDRVTDKTTKLANEALQHLIDKGLIGKDAAQILEAGIQLKESASKMDKSGDALIKDVSASLEAANAVTKLIYLTGKCRNGGDNAGIDATKMPDQETVRACASGKDRTMMAVIMRSAIAIFDKLKKLKDAEPGLTPEKVLEAMLVANHVKNQNGSAHTGGNDLGNGDCRRDNRLGATSVLKRFLGFDQSDHLTPLSKLLYKLTSVTAEGTMDVKDKKGHAYHNNDETDKAPKDLNLTKSPGLFDRVKNKFSSLDTKDKVGMSAASVVVGAVGVAVGVVVGAVAGAAGAIAGFFAGAGVAVTKSITSMKDDFENAKFEREHPKSRGENVMAMMKSVFIAVTAPVRIAGALCAGAVVGAATTAVTASIGGVIATTGAIAAKFVDKAVKAKETSKAKEASVVKDEPILSEAVVAVKAAPRVEESVEDAERKLSRVAASMVVASSAGNTAAVLAESVTGHSAELMKVNNTLRATQSVLQSPAAAASAELSRVPAVGRDRAPSPGGAEPLVQVGAGASTAHDATASVAVTSVAPDRALTPSGNGDMNTAVAQAREAMGGISKESMEAVSGATNSRTTGAGKSVAELRVVFEKGTDAARS